MTSKERILAAIRHEEADRVPMDVWMYNPGAKAMAAEKYGDLDTFFEAMNIDMVTAFPTKNTRK